MSACRILLVLAVPAFLAAPASAGIFFNRTPKPNPATRVPELIAKVRTEKDDHKRAAAIQELRHFDPAAFPEIIPALSELALGDSSASVRLEAIQGLAKLRPISQQAGATLEQVVDTDKSMRVRLQARSLLIQYHLSGYRASKKDDQRVEGPKLDDPPIGVPPGPATVAPAPAAVPPARFAPVQQAPAAPVVRPSGARPLPVGPATVEPPLLVPPPGPASPQGPELSPPE